LGRAAIIRKGVFTPDFLAQLAITYWRGGALFQAAEASASIEFLADAALKQ